ncbi:MAG: M42 family metallopeptidase [Thermoleophilaceae bacterium]
MSDHDLHTELTALTELPGPSGDEAPVAGHLTAELARRGLAAETDAIGNVVLFGRGHVEILVTAHMDQVGFMVSRVDDGHAVCLPVGAPDLERSTPVRVIRRGQTLTQGRLEPPEGGGGAILRCEQAGLVGVGDRVLYEPSLRLKGGGLVAGSALDNRIGCLLLLEAAAELAPDASGLAFAWTVREETEGAGVLHAARALDPAMLVSVDTTDTAAGGTAGGSKVAIGGGPALTLLDEEMVAHGPLLDAFTRAAAHEEIVWQPEVVSEGGSEGGVAHSSLGLPALALLVAIDAAHSPVESADLGDVVRARAMLIAGLREAL